jgi:hypothetical protein
MPHRSSKTGRYVSRATAKRHPRTTVSEAAGANKGGCAYRSAITGRYVSAAAAQRHPNTTIAEN